MVLRPQDLVVALKLAAHPGRDWIYSALARDLAMSASGVHNSVKRLIQSNLMTPDRTPVSAALLEFLVHGVRYAFPPKTGAMTRGIPTAHAAAPLADVLRSEGGIPPVWPFAEGEVRGISFFPLFHTVPAAAKRDRSLYELLALVDALRGGRAREREQASRLLQERLR